MTIFWLSKPKAGSCIRSDRFEEGSISGNNGNDPCSSSKFLKHKLKIMVETGIKSRKGEKHNFQEEKFFSKLQSAIAEFKRNNLQRDEIVVYSSWMHNFNILLNDWGLGRTEEISSTSNNL